MFDLTLGQLDVGEGGGLMMPELEGIVLKRRRVRLAKVATDKGA